MRSDKNYVGLSSLWSGLQLHPNVSNISQHNYFWPAVIDFHIGQASGFFHTKIFLAEWIYLNTEDFVKASLVCAAKFISLVENF